MSRITQKGATGPLSLTANGLFQTSTDADLLTLVGTRWDLSDGREVILVKAGSGTTIASGKLYQDAAIVPNHQNLDVTAFTAYSANGNVPAKITVTLGNTAATANQYRGGFVIVNDVTGEGQTLRIASHPAADASASVVITLEDGANTALGASSEICLLPPHGQDVIIYPTTPTGAVAGVALCPIAASSYGFLTTKGLTSCLAEGTITVGTSISPSTSVAGAVATTTATTIWTSVGYANQAGVDTEYRCVFVNV